MPRPPDPDPEQSLSIRAAWLHYVGGLTQAEVARRLCLPSVKAHRLIARAVDAGAVRVTIEGAIVECVELETRLCARFGLDHAEVAPDLGEEGLPLRTLGPAGAAFLRREIAQGDDAVIGFSHGRTLAAAVRHLPRLDAGQVRFVSLLGGLTRNYAANPHDVMHALAEKTGAPTFILPVPYLTNSPEDHRVILAQPGVREIFEMSNRASLKVAGIGTVDATAQMVTSGMIEAAEIDGIRAAGGVGEMLGHFFDSRGRVIETALGARTMTVRLDSRGGGRIVAIAGGAAKRAAIAAVLESGRLAGLITDEATARALLG